MIRQAETMLRDNPVLGQLLRFGIAGGISTLIYSAVYLPLTTWVWPGPRAVYAVPFAFAVAVTAGGESGDPKSRHFNDQAERDAAGDLRPVYFYTEDLNDHIERRYHPGK